jgi:uncharacterized LabA/DUF88 family protein
MAKTRIFIDYWNFQLNLIEVYGSQFRIDWAQLSQWIIRKAQGIVDTPLEFEGTQVYVSFDPSKEADKKLVKWVNEFLDRQTGVEVILTERRPKNPPVCQECKKVVLTCPTCGKRLKATIEKGVDTAIVTDLISLAWEDAWEYAILVSSDRDFIPAVDMLNRKGFHVINAHFPPSGKELEKHCWANISLSEYLTEIEFKKAVHNSK